MGASPEAVGRASASRRVVRALVDVGLDPDTRFRYPHEFSGGQRQRIAVARAIVLEPTFVVLDEPTSALDMLIQSQIVDLLRDLQKRRNLTYLFISHDLKVVAALASRLIVMRHGKVVEEGPAAELFANPKSDYTRALFAAAFNLETARARAWWRSRACPARATARSRPAPMRAILLAITDWNPKGWDAALPHARARSATSGCGRIASAIPPTSPMPAPGSRRTGCSPAFRTCKAIFSLGAGVDHLVGDPTLPDVPVVRIVDPDLTMRMTEYVVLHVLMHHRRQRLYDTQQRERLWHEHEQPAASEVAVGVMGLGVLGRDAAAVAAPGSASGSPAGAGRRRHIAGIETFHGADGLDAFLRRTEILVCLLPADAGDGRAFCKLDAVPQAQARRRARRRLSDQCRRAARCRSTPTSSRRSTKARSRARRSTCFRPSRCRPESPLWTHPKVTITPHNAAAVRPAHARRQCAAPDRPLRARPAARTRGRSRRGLLTHSSELAFEPKDAGADADAHGGVVVELHARQGEVGSLIRDGPFGHLRQRVRGLALGQLARSRERRLAAGLGECVAARCGRCKQSDGEQNAMRNHGRSFYGMPALNGIVCPGRGILSLLPPPLWGRVGEGGDAELRWHGQTPRCASSTSSSA